jgi:hypothetical protein
VADLLAVKKATDDGDALDQGSVVEASAAPRKDHAKPDSPCLALHGLKWSDDKPR